MAYKTCPDCGSRIFEHGCVNCNEIDYISMQQEPRELGGDIPKEESTVQQEEKPTIEDLLNPELYIKHPYSEDPKRNGAYMVIHRDNSKGAARYKIGEGWIRLDSAIAYWFTQATPQPSTDGESEEQQKPIAKLEPNAATILDECFDEFGGDACRELTSKVWKRVIEAMEKYGEEITKSQHPVADAKPDVQEGEKKFTEQQLSDAMWESIQIFKTWGDHYNNLVGKVNEYLQSLNK